MRFSFAATLSAVASGQMAFFPIEDTSVDEELGAKPTTSDLVHPTLCDPSVKQTAGYLAAGTTEDAPQYYFWLFEAKIEPDLAPLIMWLSGGPGCSSQLALFKENGPCTITADGTGTETNPYSWHQKANVVWVDQPAGVGFSTGLGTHNENGVANNMFVFLQNFFKKLPKYQDTDFYLFGESYGGHYVPAISHRIWEGNNNREGLHIPLSGIAIGNGLTNPEIQYQWYPEMGHTGGKPEGGHAPGVIPTAVYEAQKLAMPACVAAIKACNADLLVVNNTACIAAVEACNIVSMIPYEATRRNPYDMRIPCEHGRLCYDFSMVSKFLNNETVQQQLGTTGKWGSCNTKVTLLFQLGADWMVNFHTKIPDLLHDGISVLIYAGDVDFVCNWLGNKAWVKDLLWDQKEDFNNAEDLEWHVDSQAVARHRNAGNLHFMQIYEAGHMVPMDKPKEALEMVNHFVSGQLTLNDRKSGLVV